MFCGSIALMLSADPELLPWDLKEIITSTATDVGPQGVDYETGHGLINCYRAVKEVLRRKALREGVDPKPYQGRTPGDEIDIREYQKKLDKREVQIAAIKPNGRAMKAGMRAGDVIVACDNQPIRSAKEWKLLLNQADQKDVTLIVRRGDTQLEFVIKADAPTLTRVRESFAAPVFR